MTTVVVANVSFVGAEPVLRVKNRLLVYTNSSSVRSQRMEIPYSARVVHGKLTPLNDHMFLFPLDFATLRLANPNNSTVELGGPMPDVPDRLVRENRSLLFRNDFAMPLILRNVSFNDSQFRVLNGSFYSRVVQPGESFELCVAELTPLYPEGHSSRHFIAELSIRTNLTVLSYPLYAYSSKLVLLSRPMFRGIIYSPQNMAQTYSSSSTTEVVLQAFTGGTHGHLMFGSLAPLETRIHVFVIHNPNGIAMRLRTTWSHTRGVSVRLSVREPVLRRNRLIEDFSVLPPVDDKGIELRPRTSAYWVVLLTVSAQPYGEFASSIFVESDQELIDVHTSYTVVNGSIQLSLEAPATLPSSLVNPSLSSGPQQPFDPSSFPPVFPGARAELTLYAESFYSDPVEVEGVSLLDHRFGVQLGSGLSLPSRQKVRVSFWL